jgi:ATP synthase protein I
MADEGGEEEDRLLRARLEKLSGALETRRETSRSRRAAEERSSDNSGAAMAMGLRAASEFVAAIVVGGLIGWGLDVWLGTKPAFLIAFFLLGVAAGVVNVIRATSPSRGSWPVKGGTIAPPPAKKNGD